MNSIYYALILLVGVFIGSISQVLLKMSAIKKYDNSLQEYLNPMVIIAYAMFVGTTFLSVLSYRGIPLSMGPMLESTSYIYVTYFGAKIFGERINRRKIIAIILILAGIMIFSLV